MKLTIEVRDDWLSDVHKAVEVDGSNDDEHDLLVELADEVSAQMPKPRPRYSFSVVELVGQTWSQGEVLYDQSSTEPDLTAPELAEAIANNLDEWIARCTTVDPDDTPSDPALEINITRRENGET